MNHNVQIANDNFKLAQKTARVSLSAYIQVLNVKITQMKEGDSLALAVTFLNDGRTPAFDMYAIIRVKPGGRPSDKTISPNEWSRLRNLPPSDISYFVGSHDSVTVPIPTPYVIKDNTTIPAWRHGYKFLGIFGYIFYKNVFRDSCYSQISMFYDHRTGRFKYRTKDNDIYTGSNPN